MQTFLFTDIEGSTGLWSRSPAGMAAAVLQQEVILRVTIERHGGEVFKTVGDGVYAVFSQPENAVEAAVAAQRLLREAEWAGLEPGSAPMIRMGIHSGPAEARDGDYFGPSLNRLSRTLAAGHGGQILCTDDSVAACGEHWPKEIELRDLGGRSLRDVAGSGRIFQLVAIGLPEQFPPLATLEPRAHNLPHWPTPLIGRDDEQSSLRAQLRARETRLVTVLGTGGVGKTRLATEVAKQLLDEFQDGIRFVDLSALRDNSQVLPAIVQITGATDQLLEQQDALLDWLRHRSLLMVLDNCEQVVDGVASIASEMLSAAPGIVILATSRTPIRIRGERQFALEPLPLPIDAEHAETNPGVRLFSERAQEASQRFQLDAKSAPVVAEICRIVDGLPLAIELAAPWVRILSPAALHRRLQESRSMLRDGARDLPARQRTLAATIAWSYALLESDGQRAFRRLAVFRGGIAVEAAAAVIWDDPVSDPLWALSQLDALLQANLLQAAIDPSGEPRFVMLQTIQEFASDVLWQSGEHETAAAAHAEFFTRLAAEAQTHYRTESSPRWLDRLDLEFENLRAAIEFEAAAPGRNESALRLIVTLAGFLDHRCHMAEARDWLDSVYQDEAPYPLELRVEALFHSGNAWLNNPVVAAAKYRRAIEVAEYAGDAGLRIRPVASLSVVANIGGDYETAMSMARDVLLFGQQTANPRFEALGHSKVAHVASEAGAFELALSACREARGKYGELGDLDGEAWIWVIEGRVNRRSGHREAALLALDRALVRFIAVGDDEAMGLCDLERGLALLDTDLISARTLIEAAIIKMFNINDAYSMIELIEGGARLLVRLRVPAEAAELMGAARRLREQTGIVSSASDASSLRASIASAIEMSGQAAFDMAVERGLSLSPRAALERYGVVSPLTR